MSDPRLLSSILKSHSRSKVCKPNSFACESKVKCEMFYKSTNGFQRHGINIGLKTELRGNLENLRKVYSLAKKFKKKVMNSFIYYIFLLYLLLQTTL